MRLKFDGIELAQVLVDARRPRSRAPPRSPPRCRASRRCTAPAAIHLARLRLAADRLPERIAVVEVVGDERAVRARGLHRLFGHERRRSRRARRRCRRCGTSARRAGRRSLPSRCRPGFSCEMAVCPRSEQPSAARTPKPRSVKFRPLRTVRPTPSYSTHVTRCSTPPWNIRSSTSRPTGLSASAVTTAVRRPKQRFSPRATLYSPPPSQTWNVRVVWTRPSPGIEPQHHFAQGDAIPAAGLGRAQRQLGHGETLQQPERRANAAGAKSRG